jgi:alanine racemase
MNLTMVEVTGIPEVKAGDRAVFLGRDQGEELRAEELAGWAQTISYEVFCALGTANLRRYTGV